VCRHLGVSPERRHPAGVVSVLLALSVLDLILQHSDFVPHVVDVIRSQKSWHSRNCLPYRAFSQKYKSLMASALFAHYDSGIQGSESGLGSGLALESKLRLP